MPQCKHCPIVKECNKEPLTAEVPQPTLVRIDPKTGRKIEVKKKAVKTRLCPLLIMLGQVQRRMKTHKNT